MQIQHVFQQKPAWSESDLSVNYEARSQAYVTTGSSYDILMNE